MRTLLILRHAKASWKPGGLDDHSRPLHLCGRRESLRVAKKLAKNNVCPKLILSSTAQRARSTAETVAQELGPEVTLRLEKGLYLAKSKEIVTLLCGLRSQLGEVLVVGHNPGLEDLIFILTGRKEQLLTASLARIELPISSWADLCIRMNGTLKELWFPDRFSVAT